MIETAVSRSGPVVPKYMDNIVWAYYWYLYLLQSSKLSLACNHVCSVDDFYRCCAKIIHEKFPNFSGMLPPNDEQKAAVNVAMFQPFTLIQGPPGTGKTVTVVRLTTLYVYLNRELDSRYRKNNIKPQVMICGPSNKSVDVIAGKNLCYKQLISRK